MVTRWYSTAEVAEQLSLSADTVRHFIRAGVLGASFTNPYAGRPTYRVSEHHLRAYQRSVERAA